MKKTMLLAFLLLAGAALQAQKYAPGPQVLSFHSLVDGTDQPYGLYLPPDFDENKAYPLVVMLHGAGSNHRLALRRVFGRSNAPGENDVDASLYFPRWTDVPYIVATPLARGTMGYQGIAEKDVWDMIADVKRRFKTDENRTYLTGLSMGGGGTLWLGLTRPDFWAAIAPVCPAPPEGTELYLPNAAHLPTHFFHGDADPVVPIASVNRWVEGFKSSGTHVEYDVYPGVKHDSWVNAYADGRIFRWFDQYKRDPDPKKVVFATNQMKYNRSFWVEIVAMSPGKTARIEAEIKSPTQVNMTLENVDAFRLLPTRHLKTGAKVTLMLNGKKLVLENFKETGIIQDVPDVEKGSRAPDFTKTPRQAGPMTEVTSDRHIYVYGTLDSPDKAETERRRKMAEAAADWSFYRGEFLGRVMIFPRVLADKELTPNDYDNSNLVLFGTDKTNAAIARYADKLPFKASGDTTQLLAYVYPSEKNLVLINSGLPFWQLADVVTGEAHLRILRNPSKSSVLAGYGDWVFYSRGKVISGYFGNRWEVRPEDKAALEAAGILK
ncbi:MAG: dienelactone hydrolase family protein [Leadbetterella sp.]|nr:dienelactone hydrolase family protein [Leadbetterella sp.]